MTKEQIKGIYRWCRLNANNQSAETLHFVMTQMELLAVRTSLRRFHPAFVLRIIGDASKTKKNVVICRRQSKEDALFESISRGRRGHIQYDKQSRTQAAQTGKETQIANTLQNA